MDKLIKDNNNEYRQGKVINIIKYLDELENDFIINLRATCDVYDSYDAAYFEAESDYTEVSAELKALKLLGYIDAEEFKAMLAKAIDIKNEILDDYKNRITENKED